MIEQLLAVATPYGPVGLLCVYFMWKEDKRDKHDALHATRMAERDVQREQWIKDRIDADLAMARAMTILGERIKR